VNDYSAVKEVQAEYNSPDQDGSLANRLLRAESVTGKCYVVTFSPAHNRTLADMAPSEILPVIETWTDIYTAHISPHSPLAKVAAGTTMPPHGHTSVMTPNAQYKYMQIFENKGDAMGCSNPHPHGQIWTVTGMPEEPAAELAQMMAYRREQGGSHMLEDYATLEAAKQERVVWENDQFVIVCPWWATWPFETMIVSKTHKRALVDFSSEERAKLAEALSVITSKYDKLFDTQFPYSMGLHQAPLEGSEEEINASYFHMHFYPPLLRSATVRKFLVGYEMLAEPQRDITAEQAAGRLRKL